MCAIRVAADDVIEGSFTPGRVCVPFMSSQRQELRPIYTIDAYDRLVEFNGAFIESIVSATGNAGTPSPIGRSIWDFVVGSVPRQLWEILYDRVRAVGAPVFVPLRADTASQRCVIDLELHPLGDRAIRHVRECVLLESRPAIAWCARIQVCLGSWQEVEQAQATLRLEATESLPTVRESACAACTQSVLKTFPARVA
jgi:hypothetical protein